MNAESCFLGSIVTLNIPFISKGAALEILKESFTVRKRDEIFRSILLSKSIGSNSRVYVYAS